jgi:hypothetical protein
VKIGSKLKYTMTNFDHALDDKDVVDLDLKGEEEFND